MWRRSWDLLTWLQPSECSVQKSLLERSRGSKIILQWHVSSCGAHAGSSHPAVHKQSILRTVTTLLVGRDSSVGIETHYGLDGPGSNPGVARFSAHPPWGPSSVIYSGYQVIPWSKAARGSGVNKSPTSSAETKERIELQLYSPSVLSGQVIGWSLLRLLLTTPPPRATQYNREYLKEC